MILENRERFLLGLAPARESIAVVSHSSSMKLEASPVLTFTVEDWLGNGRKGTRQGQSHAHVDSRRPVRVVDISAVAQGRCVESSACGEFVQFTQEFREVLYSEKIREDARAAILCSKCGQPCDFEMEETTSRD